MNPIAERFKTCMEEIRSEYKELKRGGNVDPLALKEEISSFIHDVKRRDEAYKELRNEAVDMLIDVTFIIKENRCAPLKARFSWLARST